MIPVLPILNRGHQPKCFGPHLSGPGRCERRGAFHFLDYRFMKLPSIDGWSNYQESMNRIPRETADPMAGSKIRKYTFIGSPIADWIHKGSVLRFLQTALLHRYL